jgi:NAD(P)-dependent dehydrogenase (short-subunit alcohol dehydrogenase family)
MPMPLTPWRAATTWSQHPQSWEAQELVAQARDRVLALQLDVDRSEDTKTTIDAAVVRFRQIDVLINNAGYGVIGALEETSEAELRTVMETKFFGAMAAIMAALPTFRAQRSGRS